MCHPKLKNFSVVITRPSSQADGLANAIRQRGGEVIFLPLLVIVGLEDYLACDASIAQLPEADGIIFISPTAVEQGMLRIKASRHIECSKIRNIFAIGSGTKLALSKAGFSNISPPEETRDSEGLLKALEKVEVSQKKWIIFKGVGGRDLLGSTLQARGANVLYAECYRRVLLPIDEHAMHHISMQPRAWVISSSEAMRKLMVLMPLYPWIKEHLLFAHHPRIAQPAQQAGLSVYLCDAQGDSAMANFLFRHCVAQG